MLFSTTFETSGGLSDLSPSNKSLEQTREG
jgi:hypothetical protein